MAILYMFHNLFPSAEYSGITEGQRNARVFLLGMFIYTLIYIMLKNCELNGTISEFIYPTYKVAFYTMLIADFCVMAWTYKNYFGRSVLNEVGELISDDSKSKYDYDYKKHKYIRKNENKQNENQQNENRQNDDSHDLEKVMVKINPKNDDENKVKEKETEKTTDRKLSDTKKTPSQEKTTKSHTKTTTTSSSDKSTESTQSKKTPSQEKTTESTKSKKSVKTTESKKSNKSAITLD